MITASTPIDSTLPDVQNRPILFWIKRRKTDNTKEIDADFRASLQKTCHKKQVSVDSEKAGDSFEIK